MRARPADDGGAGIGLEVGTVDGEIVGQRFHDRGHHVVSAILGIVARDLLQRDDIGATNRIDDAGEVIAAVEADAVLNVVGHYPHDKLSRAGPQKRPAPLSL